MNIFWFLKNTVIGRARNISDKRIFHNMSLVALLACVGVVSGCALIGDYILTIALSVASGADAMFSMLPVEMQVWKLKFSLGIVVFLTLLNLRGAKESVVLWVPVFFVFVLTYTFAIIYAISAHFR